MDSDVRPEAKQQSGMETLNMGKPFLIAGGGIGGFAVALSLAKRGFDVKLIEQAPAFAEIGAGIQLGPNFFKMAEHLGIADRMAKLSIFPDSLMWRDSISGEKIAELPLGAPFVARFGHPYALIHRADMHAELVAACQEMPNISMEVNAKLVSYDETADGVIAHIDDGRQIEGRALIGCDGLWSKVREQLLDDGKPRVSGHIAYRAILPTSEVPPDQRWHSMCVWSGEKTHLVQYPLRDGEIFNLVAVFHSERYEEGWDSFGDPEELHERFAGACPQVRGLLAKIDTWKMWVLCDRDPVRRWNRGRVALLGDAAHPTLQYFGQGANMAVEDGVFLADEVAKTPDDIPGAFERYCDKRYLRTGQVQLFSRQNGEMLHASGIAREIRNKTIGRQMSYEGSAWVYDIDAPDDKPALAASAAE